MPTPTSRLSLLKPTTADNFVTADIAANWQKIDDQVAVDSQGTLAARPAAGVKGRYYYGEDTGLVYRDNGVSWVVVGQTDHGALGGLADNDHPQYALKAGGANTFTGTPQVGTSKMWHAGNDGHNSGLNADLLDGNHASAFATAHNHPYAATSHTHPYSPTGHDHIGHVGGSYLLQYANGSRQSNVHFGADGLASRTPGNATVKYEVTFTPPGAWGNYDMFIWGDITVENSDKGSGHRMDVWLLVPPTYLNVGGQAQAIGHDIPACTPAASKIMNRVPLSGRRINTSGNQALDIIVGATGGYPNGIAVDNLMIFCQMLRRS